MIDEAREPDGDEVRHADVIVNLAAHRPRTAGQKPQKIYPMDWPEKASNGPRSRSVANFRAFCVERQLQFRLNKMALTIEAQRAGQPWTIMTDAFENAEWLRLTEYGCDMPTMFFHACVVDEAHRNSFDPGLAYLNSLAWDGQHRLDSFFIRNGGAPDTPITRAMTRAFFIGGVKRLREPGCKFDLVLLLDGGQGKGKSHAIESLCPSPEWHCDSLEVGADPKVTIEQTAGKWIVELAEMAGMGRREVERVKAFITRRVDRARPAYGRQAIDVPRRFVFFATVNSDASGQIFGDVTGNRRWLPIEITQPIDCTVVASERDQLWAEAAQAEAKGELPFLSGDMVDLARDAQDARTVEDPWGDILADLTLGAPAAISVSDAWSKVAPDVNRRDAHAGRRIANAMARLGYVKSTRTFNGRTEKIFRRTSTEVDENA